MQFFNTSEISPNLSKTPEGFLVCHNVPIARIGDQTYYEGEVPVTADENGAVIIHRSPEEVFSNEAITSFEGKPITMSHPDSDVNPGNWKDLAIGHTQNIRRGEGIEGDILIGDMVIMDGEAIKAIQDREIREVSCGYDAEYEEMSPGKGRQLNIRGNHVALVERGRCGSLCAIHDSKKEKGVTHMKGIWKKIKDSLSPEEAKEIASAIATSDSSLTSDQRMDSLVKTVGMLAKSMDKMIKSIDEYAEEEKKTADEEEEKKKEQEAKDKKAKDMEEEEMNKDCSNGGMRDAAPVMQEVLYRSSILAPDLVRPTTDSVKGMKKSTFDETCCLIKRKSLDAASKTEDGKRAIAVFTKETDFFTADCAAIDVAFSGAAELMKATGSKRISHDMPGIFKGGVTVQSIQKAHDDFWAKHKEGGSR